MSGYDAVPNPRSYGGTSNYGGPAAPTGGSSQASKKLQQTQAQVDDVVDIMRTNVDKVLERDQKLSELDDRADALQQGASQFETQAAKLKRKYWWKNCKYPLSPKHRRKLKHKHGHNTDDCCWLTTENHSTITSNIIIFNLSVFSTQHSIVKYKCMV
uniref:vesicle-associated membrane protein 2 isoform X2 n=1 Tax=Ciona intestinalis TaxID=7719 RepID=UPI000EF552E6|nr:vesicle-associated membrane protein 2 isoform X2 [Ciona intestinalis]|eukprot:XP_026692756.1 vesicle-associated membrane protein 2 isoform X2 [Ciona intestinalis]